MSNVNVVFRHFCTRNLLTKQFCGVDACIALLCHRSRNLDDLQHSLMHIQYCMRLSALLTVPEKDIEKDVNTHFHELKASAKAWSAIKFVRCVHLILFAINARPDFNHNCIGALQSIACWKVERKSPECVGRHRTSWCTHAQNRDRRQGGQNGHNSLFHDPDT